MDYKPNLFSHIKHKLFTKFWLNIKAVLTSDKPVNLKAAQRLDRNTGTTNVN